MKSTTEMRFIETVRREDLLPVGTSITAAVSGGADSVCLLLMLDRFRRHMSWDLSVLHIDHCFRESSGSDAAFVEELSAGLGIRFELRRIVRRKGKASPEAEYSALRQDIYEGAASASGGLVAVGHTASDRAETLLIRLFEGAGLRGLGGMDYRGIGPVRRPMLDITGREIRAYLTGRRQGWVEDETNQSREYTRNRVRLDILNSIEESFPGASRRIAASSASLASWRRVAEGLTVEAIGRITLDSDGRRLLDRSAYVRYERALRLSILWEICGRQRAGASELDKTDTWILKGGCGEKLLPGGIVLTADTPGLSFEPREGRRWR
jgi:tRNA(Ile)-lysidine synthase